MSIVSKSKFIILYSLLMLIICAVVVPNIFAQPTTVKSVEIFSERLNYMNKEPGAWKIEKSAKWTGKGIAEITFDVDTVTKSKSGYTDVLFVLDVSSSMNGEKLDRVKADTIELVTSLLSNGKNMAGLITFDSNSEILSPFTNNKDELIEKINNLETTDFTNYYQALVNVDMVLKDYVKEDDKECIVLFLTDGYPNEETPNEEGQYSYLRSQYPFININGVQYEMGNSILDPIKKISDSQFIADMETLNNVLFEASVPSVEYDSFEITDYIDTNYFYVQEESDIKVSQGNVTFDKDSQKVTWKMDSLKSSLKVKMTIKAKLKDGLSEEDEFYPTNEKEEIKSKIGIDEEDITSSNTPILKGNYKVTYDGNEPEGCRIDDIPVEKQYSVLDTVAISDSVPKCEGYKFKEWKVTNNGIKKVNGDYFIMPEEDVVLRAVWSKIDVTKSMSGTIKEKFSLYKQVQSDCNRGRSVTKYTGPTSTFKGKENVYYYYGKASNNNVLFGGFCWKMYRTTDTGGVKMIYNGEPDSNGKCGTNSGVIGKSLYTPRIYSLAMAGYMYNKMYITVVNKDVPANKSPENEIMYGESFTYDDVSKEYTLSGETQHFYDWKSNYENLGSTRYTCLNLSGKCQKISYIVGKFESEVDYIELEDGLGVEDAINEMLYADDVNLNDSSVKATVDKWYEDNLIQYSDYLEDTVWCNDRTLANLDVSMWNPNSSSSNFKLNFRSMNNSRDLTCPNLNDRFTVSVDNGNGALKYPIGLVTTPEIALGHTSQGSSPFVSDSMTWTLSPSTFNSTFLEVYTLYAGYGFMPSIAYNSLDIRPSISLRLGVGYSDGDGTVDTPYIIE